MAWLWNGYLILFVLVLCGGLRLVHYGESYGDLVVVMMDVMKVMEVIVEVHMEKDMVQVLMGETHMIQLKQHIINVVEGYIRAYRKGDQEIYIKGAEQAYRKGARGGFAKILYEFFN
eukprot:48780_1